jgi:NAD(P)-dependent dehydrogenase (short-subunit alcohol dehydrogenase family)
VAYAATDITDEAACGRLVETALERFGRVDALVNCAALDTVFGGLGAAGDFAEWRATFDVNIFGSLQMTRAALDALRRNGGAVVFVSSQTQHHPPPLAPQMAYAASKSALTGAMHHLAQEVGPDGVRVNEVTPSWMWGPPVEGFVNMTANHRGVEPQEVIDEITGSFPLRRMVTDGEVAEVIAFLASDRAAGVTGQTLFVNAGEIMH